ncbi:hypothetical protein ACQ4PT_060655 [Festuca glaucescens]
MTAKTSIYWYLPGKDLTDGLCCIKTDSHILAMIAVVKDDKNLCLMVDHTNFLKGLREELIVQIPFPFANPHAAKKGTGEVQVQDIPSSSASGYAAVTHSEDVTDGDDDDETDSEFYDSDYDAEDGDDDLFLDNIDRDVNDNNEHVQIIEEDDDAGLDYEDLNLTKEQHEQLKYKFKVFKPVFKVGMLFSSMKEFRKALTAYSVNERVKVRKSRNKPTRLDAHSDAEEGCPWMIKVSEDARKEAIVVRKFHGEHTCERLWELKALTAPFLTQYFIDEFRDNQKMDLQAFAAKVQRKFNMCPNRF